MEKELPIICMRCHEDILDSDETEYVPWIPRWGMSMKVHKGCTFKVVEWTVQEFK